MKPLLLIMFVLLGFNVDAQKGVRKVSIVLSANYDFNGVIRPLRTYYQGGNFMAGIKVSKISVFSMYQYGISSNNSPSKVSYNYHQLGGGIKYHVLDIPYKVQPFILAKFSAQIATNYKDGLMNDARAAIIQTDKSLNELSYEHGQAFSTYDEYDSWVVNKHYLSTTFLSSYVIGFDFQIINGLNFGLGVGFGMRTIKTRRPISMAVETYNEYSLDAQLGLSYSIPLKKKVE